MRVENIGGYKKIDDFVEHKLSVFDSMSRTFDSLFEIMFSEKDNIIFEKSTGYKIQRTTYGECQKNIICKANTLHEYLKDFEHDSVVGLYLDNSLEWIEMFWCILKCGMRPLLMNMRIDNETLESVLSDLKVVLVISDTHHFSVKTIKSSDIFPSDNNMTKSEFGSELLVMSSGTSENIKICGYSAEEIYYQIHDSFDIIKESKIVKRHYKGQLKLLTFLPFYHIFGLVAVYIWFAFFSRTFVYLQNMAPQTIVNTIRKHEVTHIFAVPLFWETVYKSAIKEIKSRGEKTYSKFLKGISISKKIGDFPVVVQLFTKYAMKEVREGLFGESIVFLITGGSEINSEVISFFNAIGYHLSNGYGMTEIGITSFELSNSKKILNSCSVGKPMSSIEYHIDGNGELLVRGKATAKYVIEKGVRVDNTGNWFNTHDIAEKDNGRYRILGRKDDLIVSSTGENLNPNIIEPKIIVNGVDRLCIIFDKASDKTVLIASVNRFISSEEYDRILSDLKNNINELKLSAQISQICLIGEPLISQDEFKVNRRKITSAYSKGQLTVISPENIIEDGDDDELSHKLKSLFASALDKKSEDIFRTMNFFTDLGGTSLEYFAMLSEMQNEFGIQLTQSEENLLSTVDDFYKYIRGNN